LKPKKWFANQKLENQKKEKEKRFVEFIVNVLSVFLHNQGRNQKIILGWAKSIK
jgi:hypothetical protein